MDGKMHGQGKETFVCGTIFEGIWVNGTKNGTGKETFMNGSIYEG